MDIQWINLQVIWALSMVYLPLIQPSSIPPFFRSTIKYFKLLNSLWEVDARIYTNSYTNEYAMKSIASLGVAWASH